MHKTLTVKLKKQSYDINIGEKSLYNIHNYHNKLFKNKRVFVITDSNIEKIYLNPFKESFKKINLEVSHITIPAGEKSKNLKTIELIYNKLLHLRISRKDVIYALGGGVVGDITGFISSIVLRGVDWVQVPTSLLAQVDSSVGGKTGINTSFGKNLIGSFYQPRMVLIDTETLNTLPKRELLSGYAEIVKYSLISDIKFLSWLEKNGSNLIKGITTSRIYAINKCCNSKAKIVAKDEKEQNIRALLNLGHTFAHALEAEAGYNGMLLHGEAVSIGMVLALNLSHHLKLIEKESVNRLIKHLKEIGLPTNLKETNSCISWNIDKLINRIKSDKKNENNLIKFILCKEIGNAFISSNVKIEDVRLILNESKKTTI